MAVDCYGRKTRGSKMEYIGEVESVEDAKKRIREYCFHVPFTLAWRDNHYVALGAYPFGYYECAPVPDPTQNVEVDEW